MAGANMCPENYFIERFHYEPHELTWPSIVFQKALAAQSFDELLRVFSTNPGCTFWALVERNHGLSFLVLPINVNDKLSIDGVSKTLLVLHVSDAKSFNLSIVFVVHGNVNTVRHIGDIKVLMGS